jgi:hypothetical protein
VQRLGCRKTHEEFVDEVYNLTKGEYIVLGKYRNNKTKVLMRHNCNKCNFHEWAIKPNNFLSGKQRCPICSKKRAGELNKIGIDEFKKIVQNITNNEYRVVSNIYIDNKTKVEIKHLLCDTIFKASPNNFLSKNSRCPKCAVALKAKKLRKTIDQIKQDIYQKVGDEYELLSGDYINISKKVLIKHNKCGNILEVSIANFIYGGTRCDCETQSRGEKIIEEYLKNNNINYIYQHRFDDCKNIKCLLFDFYLPDKNMVIEFQGRQHYMPVDIFGGEIAFKKQLKNDFIKKNYCKINNINLLEISYLDINNINYILYNQIINHDDTVPSLV